ncbi:hypothetical protein PNQ92_12520 [Halobacterium salinarum]|uniref:hypothetical protein n=1 Tax=Halobacterium salinarum TaxID=2242 RepID=UPI002552B1CE|nr:hypothetical protein [Halobacterium salinarum]MDL0126223.1 hypothetical protein [Halobacterium salinarum]
MDSFAPIMILGIIVGIAAVTSGVGLVGLGMQENQQAPPLSTERVCVEMYDSPDIDEIDFDDQPSRTDGPDEDGLPEVNYESDQTSGCKEYETYTTGGNSPGNSKMAGGSILALFGGAIVYRSTR